MGMVTKFVPVKILLVARTRFYLDAICEFIEKHCNVQIEYAADNIPELLPTFNKLSIELIIIDLRIPGALEFVALSEKIRPNLKFIVIVGGNQLQQVQNLPGLIGCMRDDMPISYLIDKINNNFLPNNSQIKSYYHRIPKQNIAAQTRAPDCYPQFNLTKSQIKILSLIETGYSNKQISNKLKIELCTVKNHVHNILQRLQANNRCEAVAIFRRKI